MTNAATPWTRRKLTPVMVVLAGCGLFSVVVSPLTARQQDRTPPNVVLIVADYMGYADIGPYGATDIRTPSLDKLAAEGVRFSDYYAAAPICGPSRAALLSGYYPARVGLETNISGPNEGLSASDNVLVRELADAGYATGMVGKWHLGQEQDFSPMAHGFDSFLGFHSWTLGYHDHKSQAGVPGLYRGDTLVDEPGYLTDIFSEEATHFIETNAEHPFFLYLAYNTGLPPYQRPDLLEAEWGTGWDVNQAKRSDLVAMVESMDRGIGRVMDALRTNGLEDNTLVVFTYDHGGRHLVRSDPLFHGFATLWEGGIRVPLILRWPDRLGANTASDRPAIAMDITATILDAAGRIRAARGLDGESLFPSLANAGSGIERTFCWRMGPSRGGQKAVRKGKWKYVIDRGTQFLFDLDADIGERHNAFSERPDIVEELYGALVEWERSVDADRR